MIRVHPTLEPALDVQREYEDGVWSLLAIKNIFGAISPISSSVGNEDHTLALRHPVNREVAHAKGWLLEILLIPTTRHEHAKPATRAEKEEEDPLAVNLLRYSVQDLAEELPIRGLPAQPFK